MPDPQDRPNRIPWPPILDVCSAAAAAVLQWVLPVGFVPAVWPVQLAGYAILITGIAIAVAGFGYFKSVGTPVDPTGRATQLATGGIYRVTRNPMYLGTVLFFLGLAIARNWGWLLVAAAVLPFLLTKFAIEREEAYLSRRFGADYDAYRQRVRRWL